ncbi:hypothetical protein Q763_09275 [Flavobacterium beibuense F44-8]|uniref:YdhG-like domain-containing protein n=1 Tax=Flavobacterium beibuense F44-8 TaxID=1406840 RepID=A0A0A2LN18_9FLAO|nr:DUF1801 domain-containing protein [Flavobacterium beibuense]KGO80721.1 hypothetical protein Q763_09275 [Flavobacterium beibuense F44-8]
MSKPAPNEQVTQHIAKMTPQVAQTMQAIREVILESSPEIDEHIKWNSPAFYYTGEMKAFDAKEYKRDLVVYNLRKNGSIMLVFPTGATINDTTGILEGNYTDGRRMITVTNITDLQNKKQALQTVIKQWLDLIEK